MSSNTYKGYPLFNSIESSKLKAWNRLAVYFNIITAVGTDEAKLYIQKFNDLDKQRIKRLMTDIAERGYSVVRREILLENNKVTSVH